MTTFPNVTVVVVGHADQRGSDATNLVLGQQRADAVVAYLASRGIEGPAWRHDPSARRTCSPWTTTKRRWP